MNNAGEIATITLAVIATLTFIAGVIAWFYKRGGHERAFTDALNRNTEANNQVAQKLEDFRTTVLDMFHDLDKRVTRLEDKK